MRDSGASRGRGPPDDTAGSEITSTRRTPGCAIAGTGSVVVEELSGVDPVVAVAAPALSASTRNTAMSKLDARAASSCERAGFSHRSDSTSDPSESRRYRYKER